MLTRPHFSICKRVIIYCACFIGLRHKLNHFFLSIKHVKEAAFLNMQRVIIYSSRFIVLSHKLNHSPLSIGAISLKNLFKVGHDGVICDGAVSEHSVKGFFLSDFCYDIFGYIIIEASD